MRFGRSRMGLVATRFLSSLYKHLSLLPKVKDKNMLLHIDKREKDDQKPGSHGGEKVF